MLRSTDVTVQAACGILRWSFDPRTEVRPPSAILLRALSPSCIVKGTSPAPSSSRSPPFSVCGPLSAGRSSIRVGPPSSHCFSRVQIPSHGVDFSRVTAQPGIPASELDHERDLILLSRRCHSSALAAPRAETTSSMTSLRLSAKGDGPSPGISTLLIEWCVLMNSKTSGLLVGSPPNQ